MKSSCLYLLVLCFLLLASSSLSQLERPCSDGGHCLQLPADEVDSWNEGGEASEPREAMMLPPAVDANTAVAAVLPFPLSSALLAPQPSDLADACDEDEDLVECDDDDGDETMDSDGGDVGIAVGQADDAMFAEGEEEEEPDEGESEHSVSEQERVVSVRYEAESFEEDEAVSVEDGRVLFVSRDEEREDAAAASEADSRADPEEPEAEAEYVLELVVVEDRRSSFSVSFLHLRRLIHSSIFHADGSPCAKEQRDVLGELRSDLPLDLSAQRGDEAADSMNGGAQSWQSSPGSMDSEAAEDSPFIGSVSTPERGESLPLSSLLLLLLLPLAVLAVLITVTVCALRAHRRRQSSAVLLLTAPTMEEVGLSLPLSAASFSSEAEAPSGAAGSILVPTISSSTSISYRPLEEPLLQSM